MGLKFWVRVSGFDSFLGRKPSSFLLDLVSLSTDSTDWGTRVKVLGFALFF